MPGQKDYAFSHGQNKRTLFNCTNQTPQGLTNMELLISLGIVFTMWVFVYSFEKWAQADKRKNLKP